ncbi:MAG: signal peptidase I [Planctomycetota bacterium]|nr:MAG: signal peptidase I [Planctomycetota bacterium]
MDEAHEQPPARTRPWARELLEAAALAVSAILVVKHFLIEPYKVPTPSMQPTVMGSAQAGVFDRVAVDKLAYRWRDPRRFEVVVFKGPFDRSASFVKRVIGMPGEWIRIHDGDVWTRASDHESWKILRKPRAVQDELWRELAPLDGVAEWEVTSGSGEYAGSALVALEAGASAQFRRASPFVLDDHLDGYPAAIRRRLPPVMPHSNQSAVGDLRFEARLALWTGASARIEFHEGERPHVFRFGATSVEILAGGGEPARAELAAIGSSRERAIAVQNADDRLAVFVDGALVLERDIEACDDARTSIALHADGGSAEFRTLRVFRDVYYTNAWAKVAETRIPAGHYFVLGDNSQDSSDSRDWMLWRYELRDDGGAPREVRAHYRGSEHPRSIVGGDEPLVWLRDEWGEPHLFPAAAATVLPPVEAPFVPRALVTGRALAVFWPLAPARGIRRFKWVR